MGQDLSPIASNREALRLGIKQPDDLAERVKQYEEAQAQRDPEAGLAQPEQVDPEQLRQAITQRWQQTGVQTMTPREAEILRTHPDFAKLGQALAPVEPVQFGTSPRPPQQSSSEAVREHVPTPFNPADAARSAGIETMGHVAKVASGEEKGLAGMLTDAIRGNRPLDENVITGLAGELGLPADIIPRAVDVLQSILGATSEMTGSTIKNALIQNGFNNDIAEKIGTAVTLGTSALHLGATGMRGIQAMKPFVAGEQNVPSAVKAAQAVAGHIDLGGATGLIKGGEDARAMLNARVLSNPDKVVEAENIVQRFASPPRENQTLLEILKDAGKPGTPELVNEVARTEKFAAQVEKMAVKEPGLAEAAEPVARGYLSNLGLETDYLETLSPEVRKTTALGLAAYAVANEADENGDRELTAGSLLAAGGLINPKAAKALDHLAGMTRRGAASIFDKGVATLNRAEEMRRLTRAAGSDEITVGKKLMGINWATIGESTDEMVGSINALKQVFDTQRNHPGSRGRVTDRDAAALAKFTTEVLGFDVNAVARRQAGEAVNDNWILATAALLRTGLKRLNELDRAWTKAAGTPGEVLAIIDYAEHMEKLGVLAQGLDGGAEEVGRALRALQSAKDITDAPKISFLRERANRIRNRIDKPLTDVGAMDIRQAPPEQMPRQQPNTAPIGHAQNLEADPNLPIPQAQPATQAGAESPVGGLNNLVEKAREFPTAEKPAFPESANLGPQMREVPKQPQPLSQSEQIARMGRGSQEPIAALADMTKSKEVVEPQAQSPLAKLRQLAMEAQTFGGSKRVASEYNQMLQHPEVQDMLMTAAKMREIMSSLPEVQKASIIKGLASWGWDYGMEVFYDSMLKTIPGNIANLVYNGVNLGRMAGTRYIAATLPWSDYTYREASGFFTSAVKNFGDAVMAGMKTFVEGESHFFGAEQKTAGMVRALSGARAEQFMRDIGKLDPGVPLSEPVKMMFNAGGMILHPGTRTMMSVDETFRVMAFHASLGEQAVQAANATGHAIGSTEWNAARYLAEVDPTDAMVKIAKDTAAYATLTNTLGALPAAISQVANFTPIRMYVPFMGVTMNLMAQEVEALSGFNAINTLKGKIRNDLLRGGPEGAVAQAKLGVGLGLLLTGVVLWETGHLTGRMPGDKAVMKNLDDQQVKPDSFVHFDDQGKRSYISLKRWDAVSQPLLLVADVMDTYYEYVNQQDPSAANKAGAMLMAILVGGYHNFLDVSWMQGFASFMENASLKDATTVEKMFKQMQNPALSVATNFPIGLGRAGAQIERARYPMIPEASDAVDKFYSQLWYGTTSFDPKTGEQRKSPWPYSTLFGERTLYPRHKLNGDVKWDQPWNFLSPTPVNAREDDAVSNLLAQNGVHEPAVPKTIAGARELISPMPTATAKVYGPDMPAKLRSEIEVQRGNKMKLPSEGIATLLQGFGMAPADIPKMPPTIGLWDTLKLLQQSPAFTPGHSRQIQAGPGSIQADILQGLVNAYHKAAVKAVIYTNDQATDAVLENKKGMAEKKFGPAGREMAEKAIEGPGGARQGIKEAQPMIRGLLGP